MNDSLTEGFQADNEQAILPIYYGDQLANGAAYAAYRFKRFMNAVPGHVGHMAVQTANAASTVVNHMTAEYPEW